MSEDKNVGLLHNLLFFGGMTILTPVIMIFSLIWIIGSFVLSVGAGIILLVIVGYFFITLFTGDWGGFINMLFNTNKGGGAFWYLMLMSVFVLPGLMIGARGKK